MENGNQACYNSKDWTTYSKVHKDQPDVSGADYKATSVCVVEAPDQTNLKYDGEYGNPWGEACVVGELV